jgi:hypothetical protein
MRGTYSACTLATLIGLVTPLLVLVVVVLYIRSWVAVQTLTAMHSNGEVVGIMPDTRIEHSPCGCEWEMQRGGSGGQSVEYIIKRLCKAHSNESEHKQDMRDER